MSNTTQPRLPSAVVDRAVGLIARQEVTPESPGLKTPDGRVALCAGAALAVAGLEVRGDFDRAGELREGIDGPGAGDGIRRVFVEQGWSADLCDRVMLLNNRLPPEVRTRGVMEHLHTLRSCPDAEPGIDSP